MPYKNVEKRREKSRDAARSRRSKEADVFTDLSSLVPLTQQQCSNLDKASIMRLAISHLKIRSIVAQESLHWTPEVSPQERLGQQCVRGLGGFLLLLESTGDLVCVSDNVQKILGINHLDMLGGSIYEFSHPCDHEDIRDLLEERTALPVHTDKENEGSRCRIDFLTRFKCTLTPKGRSVNMKSATYKVLQLSGVTITDPHSDTRCLLLVAEPIPHPLFDDVRLDSFSFLSRHSLDLQFKYCDPRVEELLGYSDQELREHTLYDYQHALDANQTLKAFKDLYSKGQICTQPYRFLVKGGGYAWVQTEATVIYSSKTDKPQMILCIHHLVSGCEDKQCILSQVQLDGPAENKRRSTAVPDALTEVLSAEDTTPAGTERLNIISSTDAINALELSDDWDNILMPFSGDDFDGAEKELLHQLYEGFDASTVDLLQTSGPVTGLDFSLANIDLTPDATQPTTPNLETLADELPFTRLGTDGKIVVPRRDKLKVNMRTPFIPMTGDEDLMFGAASSDHENRDSSSQLEPGPTDSVYSTTGGCDDEKGSSLQSPLIVLRQQCEQKMNQQIRVPQYMNNLVPDPRPTNETNLLETGSPYQETGAAYLASGPTRLRGLLQAGPPSRQGAQENGFSPVVPQGDEEERLSVGSTSMYEQYWGNPSNGIKRKRQNSPDECSRKVAKHVAFASDYTDSDLETSDSDSSLDLPPVKNSGIKVSDIPGSSILKGLLSKDSYENYNLTNYSRSSKSAAKPVDSNSTLRGLLTQPLEPLPARHVSAEAARPRGKPESGKWISQQQRVVQAAPAVPITGSHLIELQEACKGSKQLVINRDVLMALVKSVLQNSSS